MAGTWARRRSPASMLDARRAAIRAVLGSRTIRAHTRTIRVNPEYPDEILKFPDHYLFWLGKIYLTFLCVHTWY